MSLPQEKNANKFETLLNKYSQMADIKGLVPKGLGPSVNVDQMFDPIVNQFSADKHIPLAPDAATNAARNLAGQIDASFADADASTLATVKARVSQLAGLPLFNQELYATLINSSNVLKRLMPLPAAAAPAAPVASTTPAGKVDVKSQQKELQTASAVVKGIAQLIARPGANKKVLLSRLNKYRLVPMAKLFNQLSVNPNLDAASKSLLVNLDGLFKQVKQTFAGEDLDMLGADVDVKKAFDAEGNVGKSDAPIANAARYMRNAINKFAKYDIK